ncbi:KAP family P-loop domain protein [Collimonas pratensis]|uniref:KAP family P-loop domain protein n=1 Tax=Collimonas pratensis TaxID=279113 RepID=A0A127Q8D0_9BURK|nr:KAP family P-loop domain protein [Collimonas pratensis]
MVKRYGAKKKESGFVLAVNAEWGYGKSFMLERWKDQALFEMHPTVFFNAWQNDFTEDPLLAFIAEFDTGLKEYFKHISVGDKVKTAAIKKIKNVYKPVLTVLASAAAKHFVGMSATHIQALISAADSDGQMGNIEGAASEFKDFQQKLKKAIDKALAGHNTIKKLIVEFKEKLSKLIEALEKVSGVQLPLLIFVDELDRCRPDYAIELLEGIKHLFGVPGVFFIIATNIQQLGESVKAVYGTGFDGQRYLKRFFDLQYSLREPSNIQFANLLFNRMALPEIQNIVHGLSYSHAPNGQVPIGQTPVEILSLVLEMHADSFALGLRDQLQIATILEAAFLSLEGKPVHIFFLIFLTVIYQKNPAVFEKIAKTRNLSDETGFKTLDRVAGFGAIALMSDDGSAVNIISLNQIAKIYFDDLNLSYSARNSKQLNVRIFPQNLVYDIKGAQSGGTFTPDYSIYFHLVQHAGGFIKQ